MKAGHPIRHALGTGLIIGLTVLAGFAQKPSAGKSEDFWEVRRRQEAAAAVQLLTAPHPLTSAILRHEGLRWRVWPEPEFVGNCAPPLNADSLALIRDGTPMPNFKGMAEDDKRADQIAILDVWNEAVVSAYHSPVDAFAKSADENAHVTFAHLWNSPERYRGKVIPVKGRLVRLRKVEATTAAQKQGIRFVYEGWIFGPTRLSHPYWVVVTHLPDGLAEAEMLDRSVTCNAYFIKKMKYPAADGSKYLETPFLIGPTLSLVDAAAPAAAPSVAMTLATGVLVVIAAVALSLIVLAWHFHRGDAALKKRLAKIAAERSTGLGEEDPSNWK